MKRWDIINQFITERGFHSFLEIGTASGQTFRNVIAEEKVSVDPDMRTDATYHVTSDEYFQNQKYHSGHKFDIIFIDGLHECHQAWRDIQNSIHHLNQGGVIVMHDCLPTTEEMQRPFTNQNFWTGDVWKAFVKARHDLQYLCYTIPEDFGCGVIDTTKTGEIDTIFLPGEMDYLTWQDFVEHPEWMGVREVEQ